MPFVKYTYILHIYITLFRMHKLLFIIRMHIVYKYQKLLLYFLKCKTLPTYVEMLRLVHTPLYHVEACTPKNIISRRLKVIESWLQRRVFKVSYTGIASNKQVLERAKYKRINSHFLRVEHIWITLVTLCTVFHHLHFYFLPVFFYPENTF